MACRIHHVAYVENLYPRRYSNLSTAFIKPMLPSWIRSRNCKPRFVYFLAMEITRRKFASVISRLARPLLCPPRRHLTIGFFQVFQRQPHARLQVEQTLLLLANCRDVAREDHAITMILRDNFLRPFKIRFATGKPRDELGARHAAFIDDGMKDLAFHLTHFVHLRAQRVA